MKYYTPPKELKANGKTYKLVVRDCGDDKTFRGWWSFMYQEKGKEGIPPLATDGKNSYYLCSMLYSKEKAEDELLDKLNKMTKILSEKDIEEQKKKSLKKLKEQRRRP